MTESREESVVTESRQESTGSRFAGMTPSQTIGPFLAIGLPWPDGPFVVPEGTPGAIAMTGQVLDGAGEPLQDALVETWQADPDGRFAHPDDPRGPVQPVAGFRGFGRCPTDEQGRYRILTLKPGPLPAAEGRTEAPHLDVSVFARGMLDRLVTRIYFPDEAAANAADPVLSGLEESRRATLVAIAEPEDPGGGGEPRRFRFDICLQDQPGGAPETVFFDV